MKQLFISILLLTAAICYSNELLKDTNLTSNILYTDKQLEDVYGVSDITTTSIPQEVVEVVLGKEMGFLALTDTYKTALSTNEQAVLINYDYAKRYPRASAYLDSTIPFWFSHFRDTFVFVKEQNNSEGSKEAFYWELDNYLKGKVVNRENFKK